MGNITFDEAIDILIKNEKVCSVCRYEDGCSKGVHGGPNGPIFPPCCDVGYESLLHEEGAIELAEEILKDV